MVNDEGQGMTDAGAAEMSGSGQGEGPAGMRTEQPRRVEPLHFPRWGSRLIEASACGWCWDTASAAPRVLMRRIRPTWTWGFLRGPNRPRRPRRSVKR